MVRYELDLVPRVIPQETNQRRRYLDNYRRRLLRLYPRAEIALNWEGDRVKAVIGGIPMQEALRKWL